MTGHTTESFAITSLGNLQHGIHDLPRYGTRDVRTFVARLSANEALPPPDERATTLVVAVIGELRIEWHSRLRPEGVLETGSVLTINPPRVRTIRAHGAPATYIAFIGRASR